MHPPLRLIPESRLYPKLVDALNNTAQVMAQDFAQHFVDLRRVRLTAEPFPEFRLNHREHCFDFQPTAIEPRNKSVGYPITIVAIRHSEIENTRLRLQVLQRESGWLRRRAWR